MALRRTPRIGSSFPIVIQSARRGGQGGFERLYNAYAGSVAGYLRVQGAEDPDDLTNQVFFDAFSAIESFEGDEDGFRSWLFTIAHRRLVDDRRRRGRRPQAAGETEAPAGDHPGGDVEDEAMRALSSERVRSLCDLLPPDQRAVVLLRMMGSLSIEDTAVALGKTQTAVKALQRRAIGGLRRIIEREGVSL